VQVTGDYAQTNTCPATLSPGSSCAVNITFTPTVSGTQLGNLTVTDSAASSPQTLALSGVGSDFGLTSAPSSNTVKAGTTAIYTLTLSPLGGAFNNAVKLSCGTLPAQTTCTLSSTTVTPAGNPATVTLKIATTAAVAQASPFGSAQDRPLYATWMQLQGLGLFGMILLGSRPRSKKLRVIVLLLLMAGALICMTGCAGGTGITTPPQAGTTPGTYTVMITGTSGALQHSLPVTLIVQ
jgi:hypothetical protein